ncbi:DUF2157 domain-containing protein [Saccharopolyspora sp. CA-218241]|uniref:DUF2157 domain-containing protein n=1 Tax=Saccharopolyspora sp. CA-218241 TaxID=3240027 RepID=UPI003D9555D8
MTLTARQRTALRGLVDRGVLTEAQAEAVTAELGGHRLGGRRGTLWEVFGYLGGVLVLGGAALLLGTTWDELSRTGQVLVLALATAALAVAGGFIGGAPRAWRLLDGVRARVVAVLFALASVTGAWAVGTGLPDDAHDVLWALAGLALALAGYAALPAAPGVLAAGGFSAAVVHTGVVDLGDWPYSAAMLALGAVWTGLALGGLLAARRVGLAVGLVLALIGAQWQVSEPPWAYLLTFLLAVVLLAGFLRWDEPLLLAGGVVGMTLAVPEAVWDWTGGRLSAPLIVLLAGAVLLLVGGFGLRRHRRTPPAA